MCQITILNFFNFGWEDKDSDLAHFLDKATK